MFPWLRKIKKEKHRCEWAMKLVKVLVKADMSWEMTESWLKKGRSTVHLYGKTKSFIEHEQMTGDAYRPDTPLLLATIHGCTKIVEEILKVYPQAIEHIDHDGRNILSLAILHRRIEIIDLVDRMRIQKQRVRRNIDNYGNTLLHLVGERVDEQNEELKGPALVLQEDTLLFKRVKDWSSAVDIMRLNSKGKTAEKVFFENNNKLRSDAKEWMSENAKNCSIIAVLISTVAFAAAYTVPGGPDSKTGHPVLKNKPLFLIFTIADAISLSSSLTSVIIFLNILTSSFHFKDFEKSLFQKLHLGLTLLIFSVAMMMVAFAATLILTISGGRKWTDITLYCVSFFPVLIFMFTYIRFYKQLVGAIYHAFKQMTEATLSRYHNPKPETRLKELATTVERLVESNTQRDNREVAHDIRLKHVETSLETIQRTLDTLTCDIDRLSTSQTQQPFNINTNQIPLQVRHVKLDFPRFDGSDPFNWLFRAEQFFVYYETSDAQRLTIASIHFKGLVIDNA
nr:putative ankyrin repeat-containing domain, PGG domain protein [Tanacetum cinerariifolium]